MADPRFFHRQGPFLLSEIAARVGAELADASQGGVLIKDVAPLDQAAPEQLSFLDNKKYRDSMQQTKAGACLMRPEFCALAPAGVALLLSPNPYKAFALAAQMFYPLERPEPFISPHAVIDPSAQLGAGVRIDPGAIIGAGVELGEWSWVEATAVIGDRVKIGQGCRIGMGASVTHAILGDDVRIYPGARIGQDGFGFAIDPKGHVKVPQLGRVIIEDHVEIGANTCIDRGAGPDTVIGLGTWIDNLVQIGHNVKIGRGCALAGQVGIAGSTVVEDFVAMGGQSGVAGHMRVGQGAQIAAGSGVITDVPPGAVQMGYPALPKTQFMRHVAFLSRAIRKGPPDNRG